jgi:hypothetical protein
VSASGRRTCQAWGGGTVCQLKRQQQQQLPKRLLAPLAGSGHPLVGNTYRPPTAGRDRYLFLMWQAEGSVCVFDVSACPALVLPTLLHVVPCTARVSVLRLQRQARSGTRGVQRAPRRRGPAPRVRAAPQELRHVRACNARAGCGAAAHAGPDREGGEGGCRQRDAR